MKRWYVHRGEQPAQLVDEAQLGRELRAVDPASVYVCPEGGAGWVSAASIPELRAALETPPPFAQVAPVGSHTPPSSAGPSVSAQGSASPLTPERRLSSLPAVGPYVIIPTLLGAELLASLLEQWGARSLGLLLMVSAALVGMAIAALLVVGALLGLQALAVPLELLSAVRSPFSSMSVRRRSGPVVQDRWIRRLWVCMVGVLYLLPSLYPALTFATALPAMLHPVPPATPSPAVVASVAPVGAATPESPLRIADVDGYIIQRILREEGLETEMVGSPIARNLHLDARSADGVRTVGVTRLDLAVDGLTYELGERRAVSVQLIGAEAPNLGATLMAADSLSWESAATLVRRAGFRVDPASRPDGGDVVAVGYQRLSLRGQHGRDASVSVTLHEWSTAGAVERDAPAGALVVHASGDPTGAESRRLLGRILARPIAAP